MVMQFCQCQNCDAPMQGHWHSDAWGSLAPTILMMANWRYLLDLSFYGRGWRNEYNAWRSDQTMKRLPSFHPGDGMPATTTRLRRTKGGLFCQSDASLRIRRSVVIQHVAVDPANQRSSRREVWPHWLQLLCIVFRSARLETFSHFFSLASSAYAIPER
jgi:hypothetical protein